MLVIDLSLKNKDLYAGLAIEDAAGRLNLATPIAEAVPIVGGNAERLVMASLACAEPPKHVTLTGPMAVWAYLLVFHSVVHRFARVYYDDGRSGPVLVAAHGPA